MAGGLPSGHPERLGGLLRALVGGELSRSIFTITLLRARDVERVGGEAVGEVDHRVGTRPGRCARPSRSRGIGRVGLVPSVPVTPTRSPGRAPSRPTSFWSRSAHPTIVTLANSAGALTTSPPAIVVPVELGELLGAEHHLERLLLADMRRGSPSAT